MTPNEKARFEKKSVHGIFIDACVCSDVVQFLCHLFMSSFYPDFYHTPRASLQNRHLKW